MNYSEIALRFGIEGEFAPCGNGHINDTLRSKDGRYILQRINTNVFTDPEKLMENIENVTAFVQKKLREIGEDPSRRTLNVIRTKNGKTYTIYEGQAFRMYDNIGGTKEVEPGSKTAEDMYGAGRGFGEFQKLLSDYPSETLHETIMDFHNTASRLVDFRKAVFSDRAGRLQEIPDEVEFVLKRTQIADVVLNAMVRGEIPFAVTHNDTKINNILFDAETDEPLAVIDLDTVMPGSRLYDYGDALRGGGSTADEDETDLTKVHVDMESFKAFTRGYLEEMKDVLTPREIELLPFSIRLMTYECGIRFLGDYLNGDTYFKIHRPKHNLDRARNQFKLVEELEKLETEMSAMIREMLG